MAIVCWHGLQGQGKTYSMVAALVASFRESPVQVYTNMAELKCPWVVYFDHIEELVNVSHGKVLLDEAAVVVPSQFWQDVGRDLLARFCQMRKRGLDLWYTAQRFGGVNVNLREQTNETIECRRYGPYFQQRTEYPARKSGAGSKFVRFSPATAAMYDTLEVIETTGGSSGRAEQAAAPPFARRPQAEDGRRGAPAPSQHPSPLLIEPWWSGWWGDVTTLQLRSEPARVLAWLKAEGYYDDGIHWSEQVRAELHRRAWLRHWSLSPAVVPVACTSHNPWCPGFDPSAVRLRRAAREEDSALVAAVTKGKMRQALKLSSSI